MTAPVRPPRRRRVGGGWVTLLAILLVVGAILVVGDRIAANRANQEVQARLVSELDRHDVGYQTLDVEIGGFPFLLEVAQGRYETVTIDLTHVTLPAASLTGGWVATAELPALHVVAHTVTADTGQLLQGTAKVRTERVEGTAVVSFATLASLIDFSSYRLTDAKFSESGGALALTANANLAGTKVPITAVADISVVGGEFRVKLRDAQALSLPAPQAVKDYVSGLVENTVRARLPALPFGLTLDQVRVQPDGLAITAVGHDVPLVS